MTSLDSTFTFYDRMLSELTYISSDIPEVLRLKHEQFPSNSDTEDDTSFVAQAGAIRANFQITRIWATSIISERMVLGKTSESSNVPQICSDAWKYRLEIGEELLSFLESTEMRELEANGPSMVSGILGFTISPEKDNHRHQLLDLQN